MFMLLLILVYVLLIAIIGVYVDAAVNTGIYVVYCYWCLC